MRRDTLAFTIAGTVFGFALGYMAAGWSAMPGPAPLAAAPGGATTAPPSQPAPRASVDPDEARTLESLAAHQPQDAGVRVELGNLYMDAQRWDDAVRWYAEALKVAPDNPDVETDLGACYVHSGRPAEGLARFEAVLKTNPNHRHALYNRGVALLNLGRQKEAADAWEALLKRHPNDPQQPQLRARIDEIRATGAAGAPAAQPAPGR